jgi:tRNA (guanine37-N1)-methyltransferase
VRAWAVIVPRNRAEEIRQKLVAQGDLLKHLRIVREQDRILLPTRRRVDLGFSTEEREFEVGFVAIRSYKDVVDIPAALRRSLPSSFDVVGDVALIRLPEELRPHRLAIGGAILRWNAKIRVVMEDRGVAGAQRLRQVEVMAGEQRTTTLHVEHGLRYRVDLSRAYFSPRLAAERLRIANLTEEGEVVADPFAGVGPYAILIAKRRRPHEVHASDANLLAVDLLRANVAMNRADRVTIRAGDAKTILRQVAPVDRIILDLPHSALDFLPDAFGAIGDAGTVHVYGILERAEEGERQEAIRAMARKSRMRVTGLTTRHVRAYSPSQFHTAFDVTVARA